MKSCSSGAVPLHLAKRTSTIRGTIVNFQTFRCSSRGSFGKEKNIDAATRLAGVGASSSVVRRSTATWPGAEEDVMEKD